MNTVITLSYWSMTLHAINDAYYQTPCMCLSASVRSPLYGQLTRYTAKLAVLRATSLTGCFCKPLVWLIGKQIKTIACICIMCAFLIADAVHRTNLKRTLSCSLDSSTIGSPALSSPKCTGATTTSLNNNHSKQLAAAEYNSSSSITFSGSLLSPSISSPEMSVPAVQHHVTSYTGCSPMPATNSYATSTLHSPSAVFSSCMFPEIPAFSPTDSALSSVGTANRTAPVDCSGEEKVELTGVGGASVSEDNQWAAGRAELTVRTTHRLAYVDCSSVRREEQTSGRAELTAVGGATVAEDIPCDNERGGAVTLKRSLSGTFSNDDDVLTRYFSKRTCTEDDQRKAERSKGLTA